MLRPFAALFLGSLALTSGRAFAQGADVAAAESLFRHGIKLMDAQRYGEACPKLAESYRLDPGTGTLLVLAMCHEQEGKIASAWSEYTMAVARSQREGRLDREQMARERTAALEPRLSTLTISADRSSAEPVEIKRDGVSMGPASLDTELPIDPGEHRIEATAKGKSPFLTTIRVGLDHDHARVIIPILMDEAPKGGDVRVESGTSYPLRTAGWVVGGVGALGVAVGSVFGLQAILKNNASKDGCGEDNVCVTRESKAARDEARTAGTISTVSFAAGAVLVGAGAAMLFFHKESPVHLAFASRMKMAPVLAKDAMGVSMWGAF